MRILIAFCFLFTALALAGQDVAAPGDRITSINAAAQALAGADRDAERDSLNLVLKHQLKELLNLENALGISCETLKLSKVDAPDGSFRLITWNIPRDNGTHFFEGMLLHSKGKKNTLYELRDLTHDITSPEVPELGIDRWYGALYYEVVPVKRGGKTYYTLLGWKGYDRVETQKVIEVLHFKGGTPRFGAPIFGSGRLKQSRKVFNFSFRSTMTLRYDATQGMIVFDHLSPSRADLEGQYAFYGPDMSFDAYIWDKDHWRFERDIDARDRAKSNRPFNAPPPEPKP